MNDVKFIKGSGFTCDTWENDQGVIIGPVVSVRTYDVYLGLPIIDECDGYCNQDNPSSQWCMCGSDLITASVDNLDDAIAILEGA